MNESQQIDASQVAVLAMAAILLSIETSFLGIRNAAAPGPPFVLDMAIGRLLI
jgi:hypothetical protein